MKEYYNTTKKKVWDFIRGFFLNIIIGIIATIINFITGASIFERDPTIISRIIGVIVPLIFIVLEIILLKKYFKEKRFIAIGMLSSLILPLLLVGFCSFAFLS